MTTPSEPGSRTDEPDELDDLRRRLRVAERDAEHALLTAAVGRALVVAALGLGIVVAAQAALWPDPGGFTSPRRLVLLTTLALVVPVGLAVRRTTSGARGRAVALLTLLVPGWFALGAALDNGIGAAASVPATASGPAMSLAELVVIGASVLLPPYRDSFDL